MHHRITILTPELEQRWSDEVHYLHSLWHQGPLNSNPNPNPTIMPEPQYRPTSSINTNLAPLNTVSFKKQKKKKVTNYNSDPPPDSDAAWQSAVPVRNSQTETGWPEWPDLISLPEFPAPVSVEEQQKFSAIQMQRKSIMACQVFFSRDEEEYDLMEDDDEIEEKRKESEEVEFFLGVFTEDRELRNYYVKNLENGEFSCLACGGIGEKVGKRFKNCVALVQHSLTIAKTKGKRAHRAYGKAICQVLGWNSNMIPSIVKSSDESHARLLMKAGSQENNNSDDNSVGEEQNGILHNEVGCSIKPDKKDQIESELESIPITATNTNLAPLTPVTDVERISSEPAPNPQNEIGCPDPVSKPVAPFPVLIEEQERYAAIQLQGKSLRACQLFFSKIEEKEEDEEMEFFLGVFKEDNELRNYYEKNLEKGDFCCLVCDGLGKKSGKRFKNCVALVQHSLTIAKSKGRSAHRAYGKAICQVLGWNSITHGRLVLKTDSDAGKAEQC